METIITPEIEVLNILNQLADVPVGFRPIKSNLTKITALLKEYSKEDIIAVMQLKVIQWKKNPKMAGYLRPKTLFRPSNFESYYVELQQAKQNPERYAKHFAEINNIKTSAADDIDDLAAMFKGRG